MPRPSIPVYTPSTDAKASPCDPLPPAACFLLSLSSLPVSSSLCLLQSLMFKSWKCLTLFSLPHIPRTLYKILDSCRQLTLAQGAGEEDPSGMVTIITGLHLDNPSALSGPMQVSRG